MCDKPAQHVVNVSIVNALIMNKKQFGHILTLMLPVHKKLSSSLGWGGYHFSRNSNTFRFWAVE